MLSLSCLSDPLIPNTLELHGISLAGFILEPQSVFYPIRPWNAALVAGVWKTPMKSSVVRFFAICVAGAFLVETFFRFLPVSTGFYLESVTEEAPVARRVGSVEAVTSTGWSMQNPVSRWINEAGFVSDVEYEVEKPVIILIGDSQIESPRVPHANTLAGELAGMGITAYSFGMSGASLPQYSIWAEHALGTYHATEVLLFLSHNDLRESFSEAALFPGFHYIDRSQAQNNLAIDPVLHPYRRGLASRISEKSDFIAWLLHNTGIPSRLRQLLASIAGSAARAQDDLGDVLAAEWFAARLDRVLPPGTGLKIIINPQSPEELSYPEPWDRAVVAFRQAGFQVTDLRTLFAEDGRDPGELTLDDAVHWNAQGHRTIVEALINQHLLSPEPEIRMGN